MGGQPSKNDFDRRLTIERRSQRTTVHKIRARLEKLYVDIKKFDGVEEDEEFHRIMTIIHRMRNDLLKRERDVLPQVRNIYNKTLSALDDAEETLEDQLEDNREYFKDRQEELQDRKLQLESARNQPGKNKKEKQVVKSVKPNGTLKKKDRESVISDEDYYEDIEEKPRRRSKKTQPDESIKEVRRNSYPKRKSRIVEESEEEDDEYDDDDIEEQKPKQKSAMKTARSYDDVLAKSSNDEHAEPSNLAKSPEKRKTVALSFVKIVPEETVQVDVHDNKDASSVKSPTEKRKSILKMGIPVMSSAMKNLISKKSKKISQQYSDDVKEYTSEQILKSVTDFIEQLQKIEEDIARFVGRKNGVQYSVIRDKLNRILVELNQYNTSDEYVVDQIKLCRGYVSSNLSFLDERAVESTSTSMYDSRDDVFLPGLSSSRPMSPSVSKITAV